MRPTYALYVPADGVHHDVRPGSAIVGEARDGGIDTHYEGGGASNVRTFEEKLHHAAGRRRERYPTSARRTWREGELIHVGVVSYDDGLRHWVVSELRDETALRAWIGAQDDVAAGGGATLFATVGTSRFSALDANQRALVRAMRLPAAALGAEIASMLRGGEDAPDG